MTTSTTAESPVAAPQLAFTFGLLERLLEAATSPPVLSTFVISTRFRLFSPDDTI